MPSNNVILHMEQISKRFPGVQALDDVTFEVAEGVSRSGG